jgi:hypothetical protein
MSLRNQRAHCISLLAAFNDILFASLTLKRKGNRVLRKNDRSKTNALEKVAISEKTQPMRN